MRPERLDALADGIFAIVMTLLIIEIKAPDLPIGAVTNSSLLEALSSYGPLGLSYVLSFAVLFTYWRAHHYIMGIYAKTVDVQLMNINALFFLFVAFIPFSSLLLGLYSTTQVAVVVYSLNVILIGGTLWWMRHHVLFTDYIESDELSRDEVRHGTIRTAVPVLFAAIAILVSVWAPWVSLTLLTLAVIFNLFQVSTRIIDGVFGWGDPAHNGF